VRKIASKIVRPIVVCVLALALGSLAAAQSGGLEDLTHFPRTLVEIASGQARHHFDVWVADNPQRSEQGLMFVRDLATDEGMLFPEREPRIMTMWMKNTYIELDMVFVGADGRIVRIAEHARPLSLDTISSGAPVTAVLEIKGGEAARRGLHAGDRVIWKR